MSMKQENEIAQLRKDLSAANERIEDLARRILAIEERPRMGRPPKEQGSAQTQ